MKRPRMESYPVDAVDRAVMDGRIKIQSARINAATRLQWLQDHSTLHNFVEILYVVDGYEVSVVDESERVVLGPAHGATLAQAIDAAIGAASSAEGSL